MNYYGESTFQIVRHRLNWPGAIVHMADALGVGRFAVAGLSGGGSYLAACACGLPEHISTAAILSGVRPAYSPGGKRGMLSANKFWIRGGTLHTLAARAEVDIGKFVAWHGG